MLALDPVMAQARVTCFLQYVRWGFRQAAPFLPPWKVLMTTLRELRRRCHKPQTGRSHWSRWYVSKVSLTRPHQTTCFLIPIYKIQPLLEGRLFIKAQLLQENIFEHLIVSSHCGFILQDSTHCNMLSSRGYGAAALMDVGLQRHGTSISLWGLLDRRCWWQ